MKPAEPGFYWALITSDLDKHPTWEPVKVFRQKYCINGVETSEMSFAVIGSNSDDKFDCQIKVVKWGRKITR